MCSRISNWDQVINQAWDLVKNKVGNQIWNQVSDQVVYQMFNIIKNQVRRQVGNKAFNQARRQVGNKVFNQVRRQAGNHVLDHVKNQVWHGQHDAHWFAYYAYMMQVLRVEAPKTLVPYMLLTQEVNWWFAIEETVYVVRKPKECIVEDGKLVKLVYQDGYTV
jgi:hypothetical protein